jgi:hypothetical protein
MNSQQYLGNEYRPMAICYSSEDSSLVHRQVAGHRKTTGGFKLHGKSDFPLSDVVHCVMTISQL